MENLYNTFEKITKLIPDAARIELRGEGGKCLIVERPTAAVIYPPPMALAGEQAPPPPSTDSGTQGSAAVADTQGTDILSPIVGTFYAAPAPDAPPFVSMGQAVKKGQTLCIVEAMKLLNDIEADCDGVVLQICVKNGDLVEFGQKLFVIG